MKVYNKFVESKKEPHNKNDIWFDGEYINLYKEGEWKAFTVPLDAAYEIKRIIEEDKSILQGELKKYLKIEDSPFEKGSAENSAVLKGEYEGYSNKAISQTSMAIGAATTAGLKGWYYSKIDFNNKKITLSDKKVINTFGVLSGGYWSSGTPNISNGDIISLVNNTKYDFCSKVTNVNGNIITVDTLPFTSLASSGVLSNIDDNSIYIPERPDAGLIDFGGGALSEGGQSMATNICAHAEGLQTHAYGQYSHTEGRETRAAYASHAEGRNSEATGETSHAEGFETLASGNYSHAEGSKETIGGVVYRTTASGKYSHAEGRATVASGNCSHSEGRRTKAEGENSHAEGNTTTATGTASHSEGRDTTTIGASSHAEGNGTKAQGNYSHAEGLKTIANNDAEHASGKFNVSTKSSDASQATHFSIGIGTSESKRKNAFEVKQNGDIYIEGVEGKIQDKLNTPTSVTSDWNAQEGEAGYIKNKPNNNTFNPDNLEFTYTDEGYIETNRDENDNIIECFVQFDNLDREEYKYHKVFLRVENKNKYDTYLINYQDYPAVKNESLIIDKYPNYAFSLNDEGFWVSHYKNDEFITDEEVERFFEDLSFFSFAFIDVRNVISINAINFTDITDFQKNQALTNLGINEKLAKLVNISYSELKALRNNLKLVPGQQYRITDYMTTTTQASTRSTGNQFDVIVTADNENTLNEVARACLHEGDTYFYEAGANLAAWQIWYSLDNDAERFAWADTQNGKGVIYRMIDEWNNDIPYDFKNIMYVEKEGFKYTQWGGEHQFIRNSALDKVIDSTQYYGYSSDTTPAAWSEGKCWVTDIEITSDTKLHKEDGSAISYGGTISNITANDIEYYTFRKDNEDDSLCGIAKNNVVKARLQNGTQLLNKNIFGVGCYSNWVGDNAYNNTFGANCHDNLVSGGYIEFLGATHYSHSNNFGNNCLSNILGTACCDNIFGEECIDNIFGNNCYNNIFENYCVNNSFGNDCSYNRCNQSCSMNSFGNSCVSNSFGRLCRANNFGNECCYNRFGNECSYNNFGQGCVSVMFMLLSDIDAPGNCFSYNSLGNGVQYVTLWNNSTASTSNCVQYYKVANGTHGESDSQIAVEVTRNVRYETLIGMNSDGELKVFNLADLADLFNK